jgi:DNA-binding IclR family transcriptional regulator
MLGMRLPAHCTAAGKVYLVFESEGGISRAIPEHLERFTEKTILDRKLLLENLREVSESGYAVDEGEFSDEITSVAVPIRDYTRILVGALALIAPSHRLSRELIKNEIAPLVLRAGNDLSKRLGYAA